MMTYRNRADAELDLIAGRLAAFEWFMLASEIYYFDDDEVLHAV